MSADGAPNTCPEGGHWNIVRVALDIEDDLVWQVMAPQVIASERTPLRRTLPKVIGSQRSWRILLFDADAGAGASR